MRVPGQCGRQIMGGGRAVEPRVGLHVVEVVGHQLGGAFGIAGFDGVRSTCSSEKWLAAWALWKLGTGSGTARQQVLQHLCQRRCRQLGQQGMEIGQQRRVRPAASRSATAVCSAEPLPGNAIRRRSLFGEHAPSGFSMRRARTPGAPPAPTVWRRRPRAPVTMSPATTANWYSAWRTSVRETPKCSTSFCLHQLGARLRAAPQWRRSELGDGGRADVPCDA